MIFNSIVLRRFVCAVFVISVIQTELVVAAEWKVEPVIYLKTLYDDNVRMKTDLDNPEDSTAYVFEPLVKISGEEQSIWDVSIDARGRVSRYQDIEDADDENVFFDFNAGRKTELSDWRLNTSYERNTNFDTDYDTESPLAGLLDDRTDRTTVTVVPSVSFITSEISQLNFSLFSTEVSYDEVTSLGITGYEYASANLSSSWRVEQNHQLGLTGSYSEYESPETSFFWDNTELSIDYTYTINQSSNIRLSVGARKLNSVAKNVVVACVNPGEFESLGGCFFSAPVFGDRAGEDKGTVTDVSYVSKSETTSHTFSGGRTVIPSSFGSAQEQIKVSYIFNNQSTERLSTKLILDASETETLSGIDSSNDRKRYRVEPSIRYRLSENWSLDFLYRYIEQNKTNSDEDSVSNAVFINLYLSWPKLATTY